MDPLSIVASSLSVAAVVVKLTTELYLFVEDAKRVDEVVQGLTSELEALRRALDGISTSLAHPKIAAAVEAAQTDLDEHLWTSLKQSIEDCGKTCEKFTDTLKKLTKNDGSKMGNFFRQGFKQFKLNFNSGSVVSFRRQISSYTNTMQMALQMIGILQAKEDNSAAHGQLAIKVDLLLGDMQKVSDSLKSQETLSIVADADDAEAVKHMQSVKVAAEQIISSSATVLSSSSTVWAGSQAGDREETTGSEYGDALTPEARFKIEGWIPPPIEEEPEKEPEPEPEPAPKQIIYKSPTMSTTASRDVESLFSAMSVSTEATAMSAISEDESTPHASEDEADVETELIRSLVKKGTSLYNQSDFVNAEKYLDRVLKLTEEDKFKNLPDMAKTDLNWMIAFSCVMQKKWDIAEEKLKPFALDEEVGEDGTWEDRSVTATLALAEVKLGQAELEEAHKLCRIALNGRRKIYGNKSEMYFEALALLVKILEVKGDAIAAENYSVMLPISSRFHPDTDANAVHLMKENGFNIASDQFDTTACLAWAAAHHHENIIMLLVKADKVDSATVDENGRTLLHLAATNGLPELVKHLLAQKRIDPWREDTRGWTALGDAISKTNLNIVQQFTSRHDFADYMQTRIQWPPLGIAARFGSIEIMNILFPYSDVNCVDKNGRTPLMSAAHYGHMNAVKLLLEWPGLNPAIRLEDGRTALELAKEGSARDCRAIWRQLKLEKRAIQRSKTEIGRDPLARSQTSSVMGGLARSQTASVMGGLSRTTTGFSEARTESSRASSRHGKRRLKGLRELHEAEAKKLRERRLESMTQSQE